MTGKVEHRFIGLGLVAVRIGNHGLGVVGHDECGATAIKAQCLCRGTQPICHSFTWGGKGECVARGTQRRDEDVGSAGVRQGDRGAGVVDEEFFSGAVDLAHGALEGLGETAVVLTELGVAVDGAIWVALAVLLPQQHQGHALALELLAYLRVVGGHEAAGALGRTTHQAVVQCRLVHGLNLRPMQTSGAGKLDVFGDHPFGDAKRGGDVLVGVLEFEFEAQDVFDVTHSDPSGIGHVISSKNWQGYPHRLGQICAAPARRLVDPLGCRDPVFQRRDTPTGRPRKSVTIYRNVRSR